MITINDTIVASASAPMNQAIAIIRISGPESRRIINRLTHQKGNFFRKNHCQYSKIFDENNHLVDEVMIHFYQNPASFTGEDIVEINCHGGVVVTNSIIELTIALGARMATRGEFSKRAFLNNKIDLSQAESINDLINAKSKMQSQLQINNIVGKTSKLIKVLQDQLLTNIAICEVNIDYPEYDDIEQIDSKKLLTKLNDLNDRLSKIIARSKEAASIYQGIKIAIIGLPNVGKSSLLNAILEKDQAIVTDIAGTTRDRLEISFNLDGLVTTLIDTAGIRKTNNKVEILGINKSYEILNTADLVLFVTTSFSGQVSAAEAKLFDIVKQHRHLIIMNKTDLHQGQVLNDFYKTKKIIQISAINNQLNKLPTIIKNSFITPDFNIANDEMVSNQRHLGLLIKVKYDILEAIKGLKELMTPDVVLTDLQSAWNNLSIILGNAHETTLLDEIFKRFCLGK